MNNEIYERHFNTTGLKSNSRDRFANRA